VSAARTLAPLIAIEPKRKAKSVQEPHGRIRRCVIRRTLLRPAVATPIASRDLRPIRSDEPHCYVGEHNTPASELVVVAKARLQALRGVAREFARVDQESSRARDLSGRPAASLRVRPPTSVGGWIPGRCLWSGIVPQERAQIRVI
jgi:hypothetical protein